MTGGRGEADDDAPTRVDRDATAPSTKLAPGVLGDAPRGSLPDWLKDQVMQSQGAKLGRYALLRVLGEGGMGVVFAAYDEELDRKVAIKLLRAPARGAAWDRSWLRDEAKAMARLSHPNIVQVYDIGEAEGQLFVAMEFVAGVSLQAWFKAQKRGWREVVEVCAQAGRGLRAAHEAGLVHCDFKPPNVLVGSDGRVRVLDFGLAQLRERTQTAPPGPGEDEADEPHRATLIRGTPMYMAPELYIHLTPDARSDQFAFCVALYVGLFGQRPFAGSTYEELRRTICNGQIEAPRDAKVPAWLRHAVLRGLSLDPGRRWPSMEALLAELARDPARTARHWSLAAGAAALVAITVLSVAQRRALEAESEAHRCAAVGGLDGAWDADRRAAVRTAIAGTSLAYAADTAARVEGELDAYATAWSAMRVEACEDNRSAAQSDTLYDLRVACLEQRRIELLALVDVLANADQSVVTTAVKATSDLRRLADCADTEALLSRVAPPASAEAAIEVARLRKELAVVLAELVAGRSLPGKQRLVALEPAIAATGYKPLRAEMLLLRGIGEENLGDYERAATLLEQALLAGEASHHEQVAAEAAIRLSSVTGYRLTQIDAAARWQRLTEALLERRGGPRELEGRWLAVQASIATRTGDYTGAVALFEAALAATQRLRGPNHYEVAGLLGNLGSLTAILGDPEQARVYLGRALTLYEALLGPSHPDVGLIVTNLGNTAIQRGDLPGAREYLRRALAISQRNYGAEHPGQALIFNNLGSVESKLDNFPAAMEWYEKALAMRIKLLGEHHTDTANTAANIGDLLLRTGEPGRALEYLDKAVRWHEASVGDHHPRYAAALGMRGLVELRLERRDAALASLTESLRVALASKSPLREHVGETRFGLAQALWPSKRDRPRALALAREAVDDFTASGPTFRADVDEVLAWLREHDDGARGAAAISP